MCDGCLNDTEMSDIVSLSYISLLVIHFYTEHINRLSGVTCTYGVYISICRSYHTYVYQSYHLLSNDIASQLASSHARNSDIHSWASDTNIKLNVYEGHTCCYKVNKLVAPAYTVSYYDIPCKVEYKLVKASS